MTATSTPTTPLTKRKKHASSPSSSCDCNSDPGEEVNGDKEEMQKIQNLLLKEANYDIHNPTNTKKRVEYLSWDEYFMAISFLSAQRSKDPEVQMGACIVDEDNRIVGIGYNGFPRGCSDDCLPWASSVTADGGDGKGTVNPLHTKHFYMCHAEVNAILNKTSPDLKGKRMYVPDFPSNECAKIIIQAGIAEVVYMRSELDTDSVRASRIMFQMSGVKLTHYIPSQPNPVTPLDFSSLYEAIPTTTTTTVLTTEQPAYPGKKETGGTEDTLDQSKYRDLLLKEANYEPNNQPTTTTKRTNYLSWDDYFTAVAYLSARRSKDPSTQVGACIIDANRCIIGIGYNGFPRGCSDDCLPWARDAALPNLHTKYSYVVHAEVNAILNSGSKEVNGATLYVDLFPCNECAKVIIQSGIREVVYLNDKYHDTDACRASRIMFEMSGVQYRQHLPSHKVITINFQ